MEKIIKNGFLALLMLCANSYADTFGSGTNAFTIDFVTVGNAGNADDAGTTGIYSSPFGGVAYEFRMGTYEISQDAIMKATASGMIGVTAGPWTGSQPATGIGWIGAAAFVNWLNVSTGHEPAYNLTYNYGWSTCLLWSSEDAWQLGGENLCRNKDAYYFLPSDDEWYKAAYHKNDGATANYWDYPTGSDNVPDGIDYDGDQLFQAVFTQGYYNQNHPNEITNVGSASSSYGTFGQGGNVCEWVESANDGSNDSPMEAHPTWGGYWGLYSYSEIYLSSSYRSETAFGVSNAQTGFRVASVPEPSIAILVIGTEIAWLLKRRRRACF